MKGLTAIIAIGLGLSLAAGAASAGDYRHKHHKKPAAPQAAAGNYELSMRKPQVRGFYFRPGGHSYDFEYEPFIRKNGPSGFYPEFDPRNFQEKVLSDPRFSTTAPSAF